MSVNLISDIISTIETSDDYDCMNEIDFRKELQIEIILKNFDMLCKNLEAEKFFPYFVSKKCLDADACDQIQSGVTNTKKVSIMINYLMKSCLDPLERLIKAINRQRTQKYIADKLYKDYIDITSSPANLKTLRRIQRKGSEIPPITYNPQPPPYSLTAPNSMVPSVYVSEKDTQSRATDIVMSDQEKEFNSTQEKRNLRSENTSPVNFYNQHHAPRTPSEHDDSVSTSRLTLSSCSQSNSSGSQTASSYLSSQIGSPSSSDYGSDVTEISIKRPPTEREPPTENLDTSCQYSIESEDGGSLQISATSLSIAYPLDC